MGRVIGAATPAHAKQMERLRAFAGADTITYEDLDKKENYTLKKGGEVLIIKARYNIVDGGFLVIDNEPSDLVK